MKNINAHRFFHKLLQYRGPVIVACLLVIAALAAQFPRLEKDTTPEAFVPEDSPSLAYRDRVEDTFGLKDPMVVAVINESESGVFNPDSLRLVQWLTDRIAQVEGIDPQRVTSLATENNIRGTDEGMLVEPFWEAPPETLEAARDVWQQVQRFPLYLGQLVSRDGSGTLIVAELLDEEAATDIYFELRALVEQAYQTGFAGPDDQLHVAGQGAVSGYLSDYISADANRLNPVAAVLITLVLLLAYRSFSGVLLPNVVVLGTVATGLGTMAAAGVPIYVITNSLPVILIGIAVCDSIHIFGQYYEEIANEPGIDAREAVARAMAAMWRPVTLTTATTVAGFLGLATAADLPPMQYYGLFAALGVVAAWVWSLLLLPALLSLFRPQLSHAMRSASANRSDWPSSLMRRLGAIVGAHPRATVSIMATLALLGAIGANQVVFNDQRIYNFEPSTPLRVADEAINEQFDGTYYLDVVIETHEPEALFDPEKLSRIERLQAWMEGEGGLSKATSIVDYIKQMHRAFNGDDPAYYRIPEDPDLVAQYFLLYSTSGAPTDFEEHIDYDYRRAHIRGQLSHDNFQALSSIVPDLKRHLREQFNTGEMRGTATGSLELTHSWLAPLAESTRNGMALALLLVLAASVLFFRSIVLGLLATLPVAFAVLMVFAVMGFTGIWLGIGTSMFAAIAIGLGVDFAIHTIDRLRTLLGEQSMDYREAVAALFPTTGRALLFNLLALALGFGVLMSSSVPPLQDFGLLVAVAVATSFGASLTVLPALIALIGPHRLFSLTPSEDHAMPRKSLNQRGNAYLPLLVLLVTATVGFAMTIRIATAEDVPPSTEGRQIMVSVDARNEGITQRSRIRFELTDRHGRNRIQETVALRRYEGEDKKQLLFYREPANIRGTAFLTYDYADTQREDDQWLYLPAARKTRRISASDRGDYFLGTDLTYEDLKRQNKVSLSDWNFEAIGRDEIDGQSVHIVEGKPVTDRVADELGYGRARWYVEPDSATIRKSENWDRQGNRLKTVRFDDIRKVEGIWTVHEITVENHKTGHSTRLEISDVDYGVEIHRGTFDERALSRGLRY
ncbi:MAG: outer membrane lipoprotein-sorting protein [Gammaproteobacteria bacterium]|nr:outer membrane lipoprotein-sorting protein [Gammaproteobacteria bacterium]